MLSMKGLPKEAAERSAYGPPSSFSPPGKSALHWAAAVNNVDAALALLKNGANKDMQNNKVSGTSWSKSGLPETPQLSGTALAHFLLLLPTHPTNSFFWGGGRVKMADGLTGRREGGT